METRFSSITAVELLERLERLERAGCPPVGRSLDQVYGSEQLKSQELQIEVVHSSLGTMTLPGPPLRFFDRDDQETTRTQHTAPPVLGADGDAARRWLY